LRGTLIGSRLTAVVAMVAMVGLALAAGSSAAAKPSYVALGDSYASGTGTGVYYPADASCDQSPDSYPPLVAKAKGYALSFAACAGATTAEVVSTQLGDLSRSTALVTVQIGGNDAGFIAVLEDCALHQPTCENAISTSDAFIERSLPAVLARTYAAIRAAAPKAKVVVVGYPRLFTASGASCGLKVFTGSRERSLNQTANLLDAVVEREARSHGFKFLDPRTAFAGHEICSRSPWVNDVTLTSIQKSYHPNIAGEAAYARLLETLLRASGA
jgi:lysophospholipase L1-like esterase